MCTWHSPESKKLIHVIMFLKGILSIELTWLAHRWYQQHRPNGNGYNEGKDTSYYGNRFKASLLLTHTYKYTVFYWVRTGYSIRCAESWWERGSTWSNMSSVHVSGHMPKQRKPEQSDFFFPGNILKCPVSRYLSGHIFIFYFCLLLSYIHLVINKHWSEKR